MDGKWDPYGFGVSCFLALILVSGIPGCWSLNGEGNCRLSFPCGCLFNMMYVVVLSNVVVAIGVGMQGWLCWISGPELIGILMVLFKIGVLMTLIPVCGPEFLVRMVKFKCCKSLLCGFRLQNE